MEAPVDWHLRPEHKETKKLIDQMNSLASRLQKLLAQAKNLEEKHDALYSYYRKYYTLTLTKTSQEAGLNSSPTRDIILDYPWKDLNLERFFCLKVWEKINR